MKTRLIEVLKTDVVKFNRYIRFCRHYDDEFIVDLSGADLWNADLSGAYLWNADLSGADLWNVDLSGAYLGSANLAGANLDFSCMPLWCGDLKANYDDKQIIQQLYHVLSHVKYSKNASEEIKELLNDTNLKWVNKFHRVGECGKLNND